MFSKLDIVYRPRFHNFGPVLGDPREFILDEAGPVPPRLFEQIADTPIAVEEKRVPDRPVARLVPACYWELLESIRLGRRTPHSQVRRRATKASDYPALSRRQSIKQVKRCKARLVKHVIRHVNRLAAMLEAERIEPPAATPADRSCEQSNRHSAEIGWRS